MSNLLNQIKNDQKELRLKNARRVKMSKSVIDEHMIASLTTLMADAARPGLDDGKRDSTDAEVIQVVKKTIKGLEELLEHSPDDALLKVELEYLNKYLPQQMGTDELRERTLEFLEMSPDSNMGQIMAWFKNTHGGQYDGKVLSMVVKDVLAS